MTHLEQFESLNRLEREESIQRIDCAGCEYDCDKCLLLEIVNSNGEREE